MGKLFSILAIPLFLFNQSISAMETTTGDPITSSRQIKKSSKEYYIFSGNANKPLAESIAKELGVPLGKAEVKRFNDGEVSVKIKESIRKQNVYIIQPTCSNLTGDVNNHLMELVLMCDALKRASVKSITAIVPYYGYARQDRKSDSRVPISAKAVADILEKVAGINRIVTVDLHCGQIQGFFSKDVPVDNLYGHLFFAPYIKSLNLSDLIIVSPDAGGADRAYKFQDELKEAGVETEFAMLSKKRAGAGEIESMTLVGDVRGKNAVISDDMCDTGGTLIKAGEKLLEAGALSVRACVTHPVFSKDAVEKIKNSKFTQFITTDTIPLRLEKPDNIVVLSVAPILAKAIEAIHNGHSLSKLCRIQY